MTDGRANALLGYPADARLLIMNADDFGMSRPINDAILAALDHGVVSSTTLMTPCSGASAASAALSRRPEIAFGVHLTLICERATNRWGPITPAADVPSLVDETGHFYRYDRIPELLRAARIDEVEREYRAQIERVLAANLTPTHLDFHCLNNGGRSDIFDLAVGLAREFGLALRVSGAAESERLHALGLPVNEHSIVDSFRIDTAEKPGRYLQMLAELPAGLSEWAVHPGLDDAGSRAADEEWYVRWADFQFFASAAAKDAIEREGITLLDYRALQAVWVAA